MGVCRQFGHDLSNLEEDIELQIACMINRQWEPDRDNLNKFVIACLQMPNVINGNTIQVYNNDIYVTDIYHMKRYILLGQPL